MLRTPIPEAPSSPAKLITYLEPTFPVPSGHPATVTVPLASPPVATVFCFCPPSLPNVVIRAPATFLKSLLPSLKLFSVTLLIPPSSEPPSFTPDSHQYKTLPSRNMTGAKFFVPSNAL